MSLRKFPCADLERQKIGEETENWSGDDRSNRTLGKLSGA